ncbi:MAG: enoyl-CoA hydratase [Acidimicrobiia bacterium]|nr:enoyl-CoA hydratase/isomerase family protein [Acidimicrobiia bacterium]NNF70009.1 enoyl-CoA hydratase [Acidimicrobiia bacterium]NNK91576.1 enoyl-CoA hydratase [Acidimicrobiia bacterium]
MPKVTTELEGGVLTITLADPDNRNALGSQLVTELVTALDRADTDDDVRVVVLTNEGHVFCAGVDLSERTSGDATPAAADPAQIFKRIMTSPKPFVGRIAGHAVAGGTGLAAAMDISIAVDDAKFGFTEVRIGAVPAIISTVCLPKMRRAEAADAMLRGKRFLAPEAARLGLINRAVAREHLDGAVGDVVEDLLLGGPNALAATKRLLARLPTMPPDEAIAWTQEVSSAAFESAEGQEGMTAYLEKRLPSWAPESET